MVKGLRTRAHPVLPRCALGWSQRGQRRLDLTILDLLLVWACGVGIYLFSAQHIGRPVGMWVTNTVEHFQNPIVRFLHPSTTAAVPVIHVKNSQLLYPQHLNSGEQGRVTFTVTNSGRGIASSTSLLVDSSLFAHVKVVGATPALLSDRIEPDGKRYFTWRAPLPAQTVTYTLNITGTNPGSALVWAGVSVDQLHLIDSWGGVKITVGP